LCFYITGGYHNVAITQVVEEIQNEESCRKKNKKKKGEAKQEPEKPLVPLPVSLENIPPVSTRLY